MTGKDKRNYFVCLFLHSKVVCAGTADHLQGFLCWKDFRNAVKARSNGDKDHAEGNAAKQPDRNREGS